jgi:PAS domain S-box-containing protein
MEQLKAAIETAAENTLRDDLLTFLAQTSSNTLDEPFFNKLARYLAECLDMDFVCIDRLEGDGLTATTVAVWCDGHFEDNVSYALKDTPCGDVVGNTVCCFPSMVCQLFPHDEVLKDLRAESYIGVTLWSYTGKPIGLIAVISRKPLTDRTKAESVMKIVAVRAAGEIERLDAEEALMQSESKYRQLFQNQPSAYALHEIIVDADGKPFDYRFLETNPAFEVLTGLKAIDLIGKTQLEILPGSEQHWAQTYGQVALTGKNTEFENFSELLNRYYHVTAYSPEPGKFATIFNDITERKRSELELQDKNSELERFTYTVSHDLKSPLITINTFADMISQDLKKGDHSNLQEDLARISDAATKMRVLLDDLLKLSRVGRTLNELSRIDMNTLLKETLSQLEGTISQQQVEIVVQPDLPEIFGDRQRIGMVLQNLLENAFKYMGSPAAARIEIGAFRKNKETSFFVSDNGIGIDPRQHENIFELFKKLDATSQGTGIGLALAQRIVEVHGGRIWVESEGPGRGSRFLFTVPERLDT